MEMFIWARTSKAPLQLLTKVILMERATTVLFFKMVDNLIIMDN